MRTRIIAVLVAGVAALAAVPATASAEDALGAADASNAHVIGPGCGIGANWLCMTRYPGYTACHWNYGSSAAGDGFWDCHGVNQEWHLDAVPNAADCDWYVHRRNDKTFFWHDWCSGKYGSANIA